MDWPAIALSVRLAIATTLILLLIGLPLAAWLAFSRRRGRWAVDAIVALPLVLPPTVLGFYVLVALGPRSPLGHAYEAITGRTIVFSFQGLLVASILYSLPFAVQPFAAAFAAVDRGLIETAWCLGASRLRTFTRIVVPLARPGIVAGMVLSFAHTLGEFGVVLMVGGNLPGRTRTVSVSIYDDVQAFDYARAGRTAAALLLFSFVVLAVSYRSQRKSGRTWPHA
ncbi:MAG TPA: molybdate ABC transporter permease subunit [Vicinamibacterales bacterium]